MPRVRMLDSVAGLRFSYDYGQEVDMTAAEAKSWVDSGVAEYVTDEKVETPERRQKPVETRRAPGRPRKQA